MMNDLSIWAPLNKIDRNKYLYHYTSIEKAFKILYYKKLRFSPITATNDIFEQKAKLLFNNYDSDTHKKITKIRNYFDDQRNRVRILCFSQDNQEVLDNPSDFPEDYRNANVIGRGLALPRMWAQYSANNSGVCFIFNKQKLINSIKAQGLIFLANKVQYVDNYANEQLKKEDIQQLYKKIDLEYSNVFLDMIRKNNDFLNYNFFTKLNDWESENEYRIMTYVCEKDSNTNVEIDELYKFLEGVVVGQNIADENCVILNKLAKDVKIRKIYFDNHITSIQDI